MSAHYDLSTPNATYFATGRRHDQRSPPQYGLVVTARPDRDRPRRLRSTDCWVNTADNNGAPTTSTTAGTSATATRTSPTSSG